MSLALWAGLVIPALAQGVGMLQSLPDSRTLELPGLQGIRLSPERHADYTGVGRFVREHVPSDEAIYVGVWRHDAIVITDLRLIVVAGRRSATRFDELHPAMTDRPEVQREMIADIRDAGVRCVVLWKFAWSDERLDAIKARYVAAVPGLGATLLDEFLRETFEPIAEYGQFVVLWRKGSPRPVDVPGEEL